MPNRDETGPDGKGKLTGRGYGNCINEHYNRGKFPYREYRRNKNNKNNQKDI